MSEENRHKDPGRCLHCGGVRITEGVPVGQTADAGRVGLAYKTKFLIIATEQFFASVCNDCGTIARLYVKTADRKWVEK